MTGLDIAATAVRAAELVYGRNRFVLRRFAQMPLPVGAVVRGDVVDPAAVTAAVKLLWKKGRFRARRASIAVSGAGVTISDVEIPYVPAQARRALLPELVGTDPSSGEQVMDFVALQALQDPGGPPRSRGLLVAARAEPVATAVAAVEAAGVEVTDVDLGPFAVVRCLAEADPMGMDTRTEAVIDIGATTTAVVLHRGGVPLAAAVVPAGGQDVTARLMAELGVNLPTAESLKRESALDDPAIPPAPGSPRAVIAAAVDDVVGRIVAELDRALADSAVDPPRRLRVTGGGSLIGGLTTRLQRATGRPVERGRSLLRLGAGRSGLSPDHLLFADPLAATAVGLAIRST
jgi:type IV pilus assembly protein PilM